MPRTDPIETTCTEEPYTPSVAPSGVDRADVLTQLRRLMAECNGVAALVEGAVGKARPEFIDAFRRWYGALLGRFVYLERVPFDIAVTNAEVRRWQQRLAAWRQGLAMEPGMAVPAAAPAPAAQAAPTGSKPWPTWAKLLGLGGGAVLLWKVGQWLLTPSYTSTAAVVTDVAQTVDAVNDVRRGR